MDFSFSDDQESLRALARRIFEDRSTHDRLKIVERSADRFDRELWTELAKAGLVGIAVPEEHGGAGLGLVELCLVLEELGRSVARVPLWASAMAAMAIAGCDDDVVRARWLPGAASGDTILTIALEDGSDGTKICVPAATIADAFVVATSDGLYLAEHGDVEAQEATNLEILGRVRFARMTRIGDTDAVGRLVERATAALCAIQSGVCEGALRMTAKYVSERFQFDKPLAANQAVAQRAADAFIDTEAIRLSAWQAIWRLSEGMPASQEVAVAKFWAADGGQRVAHAAQHLHGGIGVDVDYPVHRYFLWTKAIELTLGAATPQLVALGASLSGMGDRSASPRSSPIPPAS